jgi:hypothetical protein
LGEWDQKGRPETTTIKLIRRFFYNERLAFDFKEKFSLFIEFYTKILLFFQNHIFLPFFQWNSFCWWCSDWGIFFDPLDICNCLVDWFTNE